MWGWVATHRAGQLPLPVKIPHLPWLGHGLTRPSQARRQRFAERRDQTDQGTWDGIFRDRRYAAWRSRIDRDASQAQAEVFASFLETDAVTNCAICIERDAQVYCRMAPWRLDAASRMHQSLPKTVAHTYHRQGEEVCSTCWRDIRRSRCPQETRTARNSSLSFTQCASA